MHKDIADYIYVTKLIPEDICNFIIKENNRKKWSKHVWHNVDNNTLISEKTMELDVLPSDQNTHEILVPFVIEAAKEYNQKYAYLDDERTCQIVSRFCRIRFNRYRPGQIMRKHYDHIHSIFDGEQRGIPILSFIGNLDENYEGGELVFFNGEKKLKLGTGDICIFPSCFMYPHQVYEVTKNQRHSFVTWAW